jgi:hypothetical protein
LDAGKIKNLYKVSGQRRVMGVIDAESHDELDQIMMAGRPMAHSARPGSGGDVGVRVPRGWPAIAR